MCTLTFGHVCSQEAFVAEAGLDSFVSALLPLGPLAILRIAAGTCFYDHAVCGMHSTLCWSCWPQPAWAFTPASHCVTTMPCHVKTEGYSTSVVGDTLCIPREQCG